MKRFLLPISLFVLLTLGIATTYYRETDAGNPQGSAGHGASASALGSVPEPVSQRSDRPNRTVPAAVDGNGQQFVTTTGAVPQRRTLPVTQDFVRQLFNGPNEVSFALPDGRMLKGVIEQRQSDPQGNPVGVDGRTTEPDKGRFLFAIQPPGGVVGPVTGTVYFDSGPVGYRVLRAGEGSEFTELPVDEVICRMPAAIPELVKEEADDVEEIPADHPSNIPIPAYQNGIIPLQSKPGATAVVYMDFDGEKGPQIGWGDFDAVSPNVTNTQIRDVWVRVAEDYAPFNINVTTDLQTYLNAAPTSRQRCIITPTTKAAPGAGGVALVGSFNSANNSPCWAFYSTGKNSAEVVAHEVGHTLGLSHDGRISPAESYYAGQGTDPVGWAPIMGVGYYKNLSQWSKGEYASANQMQDDLAIISGTNNNVSYRTDDAGATHSTAATLEIFNNGTVNSQGTIETRTDVDAFRFTTTGGAVSLTVSPVSKGPNLDIEASIWDATDTRLLVVNPDTALDAKLTITLPAGSYTVRVDGVGRGDPLTTGYTDYDSLGQYTITGTIAGATGPSRFNVAENSAAGTIVGTPALLKPHDAAALTWGITAGNVNSPFSIDPASGQITVVNSAILDYEALSPGWTQPPVYNLTVQVTDSADASLSETLRVVVNITDVNEPPVISGASFMAVSRTVPGTLIGKVTASDPDEFDFPNFAITAGNDDGKFAIDGNGNIVAAGSWDTMQPSYTLTVRATDNGAPSLSVEATVNITVTPTPAGYTPGMVYRTMYEGISGSAVSDLTSNAVFPNSPTRSIPLTDFTDNTRGDNYGSVVRTWLIAPMTGSYRFWIAGDDGTDLEFNAAGNPAAITRIAFRNSASSYQNWTGSTNQQSASFNLTAGQICYLEARQKEATGGDHVAVAWEIKNPAATTVIVPRDVIPGRFLSPHSLSRSAAPTDLLATISGGAANLAWSPPPAPGTVQTYRIKRSSVNGGPFTLLASGLLTPSFQDTTVDPATTYYYVVSAVNDAGESPGSNRLVLNPPAETLLTGSPMGAGLVLLPAANAFDGRLDTAFVVNSGTGWVGLDLGENTTAIITALRYSPFNSGTSSTVSSSYMVGGSLQASSTADFSSDVVTLFNIAAAPPYNTFTCASTPALAKAYRYVRYTSAADHNGSTSEIQFFGVSKPASPGNLAIVRGAGSVSLSWDAVATAAHYVVKRSASSGGPFEIIADNLTGLSYQDILTDGRNDYFYVVSAVNEAGESDDSAPAELLDSYQRWLTAAGLDPDDASSAFDADADGDGIPNGTAYMVALPPSLSLAEDGSSLVTAVVRIDPLITTGMWMSEDLTSWTPFDFTDSADQSGVPDGYVRISSSPFSFLELGGRFYRLTFTR